jgi:cell wall-associated NlpC family hydrolase
MNGTRMRVAAPSAFLRGRPDGSAEPTNELLYGEDVAVSFSRGDWADVESLTDGYRGFIQVGMLSEPALPPTHSVSAIRTLLFAEPNLKKPVVGSLSFLSRVRPGAERNGFVELAAGAWAYADHLAPIGIIEPDHVQTALRFLEAPYLWGGRTAQGLDCSALTQLSLAASGIAAPRDSGPQRLAIGHRVLGDAPPRRGDFAFWSGHVAIVLDGERVVHANAHHMAVRIEPLAAVVARVGVMPEIKRL